MSEVFLVSDTHFGHSKMYEMPFLRPDGTPMRPWPSAEQADEAMIERWNAVVTPRDKIYHLGDVAIPRRGLQVLERLNGDKVLIAGNHDWPWEKDLGKYFRNVRAYWRFDDFAFSHIPVHPDALKGPWAGNIHGHLHHNRVVLPDGTVDPRYLCVCMEHIEFTPIAWGKVKQRFAAQQP
jgi:calcineurin-like phosphoesterase family protein